MKNTFTIFFDDLKRLGKSPLALAIAIGLCFLPSLYAWFNIYSNWDPYSNTGNIKIAVVSEDKGYTLDDGTYKNMGDEVLKELEESDSIDWTFLDTADELIEGVEAGKYYAGIRLGEDFTESMYTVFDTGFVHPAIIYYENEKKNAIATKITDTAVGTLQTNINRKFIETVASTIFENTNEKTADFDKDEKVTTLYDKLERLRDNLVVYSELLESLGEGNGDLAEAISDASSEISEMSAGLNSAAAGFKNANGSFAAASNSVNAFSGQFSNTLDTISQAINRISNSLSNATLASDTQNVVNSLMQVSADTAVISTNLGNLKGVVADSITQNQGNSNKPGITLPDIELPTEQPSTEQPATKPSIELPTLPSKDDNTQVTLPSIELPTLPGKDDNTQATLPSMEIPTLPVKDDSTQVTLPSVEIPTLPSESETAEATLPSIELPTLPSKDEQPEVTLPSIELPDITLPSHELPDITLPNITLPGHEQARAELPEIAVGVRQLSTSSGYMPYSLYTLPDLSGIESAYVTIAAIEASVAQISNAVAVLTRQAAGNGVLTEAMINSVIKEVTGMLDSTAKQVEDFRAQYNNSIAPQITSLNNSISQMLSGVSDIMTGLVKTMNDTQGILASVEETTGTATDGIAQTKVVLDRVIEKLNDVIDWMDSVEDSDKLNMVTQFLGGDADMYGEFFGEPVDVVTEAIYPVETYGCAMTPFYTILALWVGGTILVSLIKVHAEPKGLKNVKAHHLFFGRYLMFFLLGQIQAAIVVWGDINILHCQVLYPFEFWVVAALASFTFTLFIYALAVSFGDIGKALAVVIMVLQIAGSSGTFPIELLPQVYRNIYIFFPFPYAINAMRETVAGMYGTYYIDNLISLMLFAVAALVIGLVIRIPFMKINHFVEKRMEDTKMM